MTAPSPMRRAVEKAHEAVRDRGVRVAPTRWQSMDVSKRAEATTIEVLNYTLQAPVSESLDELRGAVQPNLPWADDHFEERVGGKPLNPGAEWARWPWGNSANSFRSEQVPSGPHNPCPDLHISDGGDHMLAGFSHTYAERMWPKHANQRAVAGETGAGTAIFYDEEQRRGIRYPYGDASDVVDHLLRAPDSRQAYLPIWFPEDTGKLEVRVPCTLGYHFIQRGKWLHCTYYIRSCDLYRHFRDDVYLTARLQLWMLEQLRERERATPAEPFWAYCQPGLLTMHVVSLHAFINDYHKMWPEAPRDRTR